MRIPYVIDNIEHTVAQVLNHLLQQQDGPRLDVATAYFSIRGFQQLRDTLPGVTGFRLLLGDEPRAGEDVGVRPDSAAYLRHELNAAPLQEDTARLVEELIRFLRRDDVDVRLYLGHGPEERGRRRFLHAKCYLLWEGNAERGMEDSVEKQTSVSTYTEAGKNLKELSGLCRRSWTTWTERACRLV